MDHSYAYDAAIFQVNTARGSELSTRNKKNLRVWPDTKTQHFKFLLDLKVYICSSSRCTDCRVASSADGTGPSHFRQYGLGKQTTQLTVSYSQICVVT